MNRVLTQISNRFRSMKKINKLFDLLLPKIILSCDETSIKNKCTAIYNKYP
ncbi:unnamed protein product, partial [Acanthoscelides obtectus]